jgi:hypothetical protein
MILSAVLLAAVSTSEMPGGIRPARHSQEMKGRLGEKCFRANAAETK